MKILLSPSPISGISSACRLPPIITPRRRGITASKPRKRICGALFITSTHDYVLFFTNTGRVYRLRGFDIPEASARPGDGDYQPNPRGNWERVTAVIPVKEFSDDHFWL